MKLRLALAAFLLTSGSAFAADLAPQAVEPVAPAPIPVYNWTGFYAGLHAGAVFGNAKITDITTGDQAKYSPVGFIGGAHAGYNAQFDSGIVIGLEGDIDYTSLSKTNNINASGDRIKFKSEWQGSIRARAGYAFDRFLPYVTGGVAFGDEKFSGVTGIVGSTSNTRTGWTVGGGLEYAIDQNWLVRGEVRYTDFGQKNETIGGDLIKTRFNEVSTTLGVSYKF